MPKSQADPMSLEMHVTMPDGSVWAVPVAAIARHRAAHYAHEFGGDVGRSLAEDTLPLFAGSTFEIEDWAENNMNWEDVSAHAWKVPQKPRAVDMQEGWVNGAKRLVPAEARRV